MSFFFFFMNELEKNDDMKASVQIQFHEKETGKYTTTTVPVELFDLYVAALALKLETDDLELAEKVAKQNLRQVPTTEWPAHDIRRHILKEITVPRVLKKYTALRS